jgi:hypothetical protein
MSRLVVELERGSDDAPDLLEVVQSVAGSHQVELRSGTREGFGPAEAAIVIGMVTVGTGLLTVVADWLRRRKNCLLVVDTRDPDDLKLYERCDLVGQRGKTIVIASNDTQVVIEEVDGVLDIDALAKAAIESSVEGVKRAVDALKAEAREEPAGTGL